MGDRGFAGLAVVAAALALAACSSAVGGHGAAGPTDAVSSPRSPAFPSTTPAGPAASGATGVVGTPAGTTPVLSTTAPAAPSSPVAPTGGEATTIATADGTLPATIWAKDDITDCAAHAYGAPMIAFLQRHPCRGAHRVLATIDLHGREVVVSAISTGFAGTARDPYVNAGRFEQLENADNTGSINDLLREGHTIPGIASRIPAHEAFSVLGQDSGVSIFDAWYASGSTADQDPTLLQLEESLFLGPLTN
jgi:hypothetical protein